MVSSSFRATDSGLLAQRLSQFNQLLQAAYFGSPFLDFQDRLEGIAVVIEIAAAAVLVVSR
jgi:hypothetical protein